LFFIWIKKFLHKILWCLRVKNGRTKWIVFNWLDWKRMQLDFSVRVLSSCWKLVLRPKSWMIALWEFNVAINNFALKFWLWSTNERLLTKKNGIIKNSCCPNINCWSRVLNLTNDLGAHICRCTTKCSKLFFFLLRICRKPKINNLGLILFCAHIDQNIF